jgi:[acyl-carrier-protein] S-malonyltransferase
MTAIIFPGQGSQYLNMSMDFNENFDVARKVFEEIEDSTQINIRKIIASNPLDNLNQTNFTQISIFSASMAIYKSLINVFGNEIIKPKILLGHSLGEYSALVAGNFINISDASMLIKKRGELMHSSINPNISGMAAIIGKNADFIDDVIKKNNLKIVIANDNSPMQVVVSGLIDDIISSEQVFSENGVKRYIKLNVSAAFHSSFMNDAQNKLINEIDKINFKNSNLPIISNYNSSINLNIDSIIYALKNQMANRVRWTDSIKKLEETDTKKVIEIGPGKVLSGLITRITKKFDIKSIDKIEDLKKFK